MRTRAYEYGAALIVCLILVTALAALAVAGVGDVTAALAMTRNLALDRAVRSAAASAIEHALAVGPFDAGTGIDVTLDLEPVAGHSITATIRFVETTHVPSGFSIASAHDGIAAYHFEIEARASGPRGARAALRQGLYVLGYAASPRP